MRVTSEARTHGHVTAHIQSILLSDINASENLIGTHKSNTSGRELY